MHGEAARMMVRTVWNGHAHLERRRSIGAELEDDGVPARAGRQRHVAVYRDDRLVGPIEIGVEPLLPARRDQLRASPGQDADALSIGRAPAEGERDKGNAIEQAAHDLRGDRKSTRLNSSHLGISYAVFCLKKKTTPHN